MLKILILAGGIGKRMKSGIPKIFHNLIDKPMIEYVMETAHKMKPRKIGIVLGNWYDEKKYGKYFKNLDVFIQPKPMGTGHAVSCATNFLEEEGDLLILYGDVPLLTTRTIKKLIQMHVESGNDMTILTSIVDNPKGYGRVIKKNGIIKAIIEDSDANEDQKKIKEINSGIYVFKMNVLKENLKYLENRNRQGEYYLTDLVEILDKRGYKVGAFTTDDPEEISGVNTRKQLVEVERKLRFRIIDKLMENGVTIEDPATTYIGLDVEIGMDTIIRPMTFIFGKTRIGQECEIGPDVYIIDSVLGNKVKMSFSHCNNANIENEVNIGPFARLRPGTILKRGVKIGNFVEVKNSTISDDSRASHLSYIGDAFIGRKVNIGAGTITCNYDGFRKNRTEIEDEAFIGSNSSLVAPVRIGKGSIIAAGSVITDNVPPDSLGIARERQHIKPGWAKSWKERKRKEMEGK